MRKEVELLEHHADFAPHGGRRAFASIQQMAGHRETAFLVLLQRVDAADQRGLAGP